MNDQQPPKPPEDFFAGHEPSFERYREVRRAVEELDPLEIRVTKSQIAFRRKRNFALVWMPEQYLKRKTAPLVLTILMRRRIDSRRWKEVVEPAPGRFTHHLELYAAEDVDEEVRTWLQAAWEEAG